MAQFTVKDATTVRDDILRTIRNGLIALGVANPNVSKGSDWNVLATAVGNELAVVGANTVIKADAMMPDSSVGPDLARDTSIFHLTKQPAGGSVGSIVFVSSAASPIPTDQELLDATGLRYRVTVGGTYNNGVSIPIEAIDTGSETNHAEGDVLQWKQAPPYADPKVAVGVGGLVNGTDAEDDEGLRARLFAILQTPPGSGNWEHCAEVAEASDPRVQKAFVHPAGLGPSTNRIVVTAAPTLASKERDIETTVLNSVVVPYVVGKLPEHAHVVTTTVANVNADVAIAISLPESPTANPPGPGGGWMNGTTWPAPDGVATFRCTVTAVTSSTVFTVDASVPPQVGVSRIAWLSPVDWRVYTALVVGSSGTTGAYVITIDKPLTGIMVGAYIWPEPQNARLYCETVLARFALMGPGEITANVSALSRGFRHPIPANGWQSALGPHILNAITDTHDEVQSAQFMHRVATGHSALAGAFGQLVPNVPVSAENAPNIFIPRHVGFYRIG